MKHLLFTCAALSCALALSACGSSGDGGSAAATAGCSSDIPQSALASVGSLAGYTRQLVATSSDTSEPISTCNATLPADETSEPSS